MDKSKEQEVLLSIVETWQPNEWPEYRGFRCANCQQYRNEAWYHWVTTGGYLLPIHMCNETCHKALKDGAISVNQVKRAVVNPAIFGQDYQYTQDTIKQFRKIVALWPQDQGPQLKEYVCDECDKTLEIDPTDGARKGWHAWWNNNGILTEFHFHRECGHTLGITTKEQK